MKGYLQDLDERPERLLLFYLGPLTGAAFIGHHLNATVREIQLFEEDFGNYAPSMTLR